MSRLFGAPCIRSAPSSGQTESISKNTLIILTHFRRHCKLFFEKFQFFYYPNDMEAPLRGEKKGVGVIKITDPLDMWSLAQDGITFKKKVSIAYPDFLFGAEGIACKNAEIGICIMWIIG